MNDPDQIEAESIEPIDEGLQILARLIAPEILTIEKSFEDRSSEFNEHA